jgi:hypothetical protein
VLTSQAWILSDGLLVATLALPLSQCSLCAIWAATSRRSLYLRFAAPVASTIACWYILTYCLPWGMDGSASAGWAVMLSSQTLAIVAAVGVYRRVVRHASPDADAEVEAGAGTLNIFAFDLRTLMLWTTVIGIGFGFIQFGRVEWSWSAAVAQWEYFRAMPVIGLFNASVALLWLWALATGHWKSRCAKAVAAALLIGLAGYALPPLLSWITGHNAIKENNGLVLGIAESLLVIVSLAGVLVAAKRLAA